MYIELIITENEANTLEKLSNCLVGISPTTQVDMFTSMAKNASKGLPKRIMSTLNDFKNSQDGCILIKGLPLDENYIWTPKNNQYHIGETTMLSRIQAIINEYIGEMVSYEAEGNGRLFQDMVPNKELALSQTSLGSKKELELHTEQAFSEMRPDYLSLACLKGDIYAKTYIMHLQNILDKFTMYETKVLTRELWEIGVDQSFVMNGCSSNLRGPLSILDLKDGEFQLIFDQDLMVGLTTEASDLIDEIIDLYYECRDHYVLQSGEILILNNHKVVHGRSSFSPQYDGHDRFIIRSFIMKNINKLNGKTVGHSRMIAKEFS